MFKRIIFLSLILFFAATSEIFADAAAQLEQAMNYVNDGQFEQARTIYNSLLANQPDKETEILARGGLMVIDIHQGNATIAKTSADELIADNSSYEIVSSAAFDIAYAFFNAGKSDEAREYYQYIIDNWPNSEDGFRSRFCVIKSNIQLAKIQEAEAALDNLLSNLPGGEDFSAPITDTAYFYREAGLYDSARQLYKFVIDTWPDCEDAIWVYSGIGFCQAVDGNDTEAMNALNIVLERFADHPDLSTAATDIAEPYYDKGFMLKAEGQEQQARIFFKATLDLTNYIEAQIPGNVKLADTYCWMGACHEQLGEYEKAIECYQNTVDKYPDDPLAWNALFKVGRMYERLEESGGISESEAEAKIRAAYEQLLEQYPDCKAAKIAKKRLNR